MENASWPGWPRAECRPREEGEGPELTRGDTPHRVGGARGKQVDRELIGGRTVQFGELDAQQDLLLDRSLGYLQVVDHRLRERHRQRGRPVGNVFVRYASGEGQRIARGLDVDIFGGKRLPEEPAQWFQVLLDGDVVKIALAGLAPDHQRHGAERLAMNQDFTAGHG